MPKTMRTATKKKAATKPPSVLKALRNIVVKPAKSDVHLKRMRETLAAAGLSLSNGFIEYAGRDSTGAGVVQIDIPDGSGGIAGYPSVWPEWAFGVAEGAVHFNKQVTVVYNTTEPWGYNLVEVDCETFVSLVTTSEPTV